ncbi:MAG TPA: NAD(+)--rifampin ADP-ribosyltransferase, partial [Cellulomonas sp.]|nr:NAD(+)--rifampin ADP-ribosyltransferase [Cellulomonas sp.]
ADVVVFALGGASWPRLGADGGWVRPFVDRGVAVTPLRAANVAVRVAWSQWFASRFEGVPLKNVALTVAGRRVPGDAMVTRTGLEGGPVYALGAEIRDALDAGRCVVDVDLRPDVTVEQLTSRLRSRRHKDSASNWLRRSIGLDPVGIALVREAGALPADPQAMAELVKAVPVPVVATMPIDRAISSAGGIAWSEVDESLMLRALPGTFVAGEMLDWEAPTGGYLLQASFSTGVVAARGALAWLSRPIPFEVHESGALLHGTKADLNVGDLLVPGRRSNYGGGRTAGHVYLTETLDAAAWGAELAVGEGPGRIYVVEPMGPIEDDPNVTDKRFPGNPTRSFRTRDPVRVVGELEGWSGHTPGQIQAMRGGLADLERQGLAEIDD